MIARLVAAGNATSRVVRSRIAALTRGFSYLDGGWDVAGRHFVGWRRHPVGRWTVTPDAFHWTSTFGHWRQRARVRIEVPWTTLREVSISSNMVVVLSDEWSYLCFYAFDALDFAQALIEVGFEVPRMWALPRGPVTVAPRRAPNESS